MTGPADPEGEDRGVRLEATASGQATVNQAGRDQHFHFSAGTRRTVPGGGSGDAGCPYPGLASFTGEQAAWFFGRDRLTATLVGRLDACLAGSGPVMVVAASGAGKSSLLRAGLLPRVAAGALTPGGSRQWPRVVFTPGAHPLREAGAALAAACPGDTAAPADPGADDLDALLARAAGAAGPRARAVLVVDQFEELFRLCEDEDERTAFISWLWQAARSDGPGGPAALVACAVRADFYPDCTRYPQLRQALQDNQVIVGAMSTAELREAITCPAEAAGLDIEPGLTELLLVDLRAGQPAAANGSLAADDGAGRLPLLAHALQATWQQRHGSTLTVAGYQAAGGIEHAIADTAEQVYGRLDDAAQREARGLFLRLVKIGDASGEDIRRPAPRPALTAAGTAAAVTDAYTAGRLLTQSRDTVQITHEALLRAWPRLAGWLDEDRAGQLTRQQIEDDAASWDAARRDPSLLYRGARLGTAAAWAASHAPDLTGTARQFLATSGRRARRTAVAVRAGVAAVAALALALAVTSVVAFQQRSAAIAQRDLATQQRNLAVYNQVLAEASQLAASDPAAADQLLVAAYRMRPSASLQARLVSTEDQSVPGLVQTGSAVFSVAVARGSRIAAIVSPDGITLWDITSPARPRQVGQTLSPGVSQVAYSLALSPDGRTLASGNSDGSITLWDVSSPARPRELGAPVPVPVGGSGDLEPGQVAFSPDGRTLASADCSDDGGSCNITLWSTASPAHPRELSRLTVPGDSPGDPVAFSPDGRTLAAATFTGAVKGGIALWDVASPAHPHELGQATAADSTFVSSVAFSADGRILASGSQDGTVTLWDIARPARPRLLSPPVSAGSGIVVAADFSPDGKTLATVSGEGAVSHWDITSPAAPRPLGQPASAGDTGINAAAFSPGGQTLVTGSQDGTLGISPSASGTIETAAFSSSQYAFSPDGKMLAGAGADGGVSLWDISDLARPRQAGQVNVPGDEPVDLVTFSPGGRTVAIETGTATESGRGTAVTLWDITNPARPRKLGQPLNDGTGADAAAFSPDGRTLAIGNGDNTVTLWDITNPARPRKTGQPLDDGQAAPVTSLAFSPDGRLLVGVTTGITLWKTSGFFALQPVDLDLGDGNGQSAVISPRGPILAADAGNGSSGTVTLWNTSDPTAPQQVGPPLTDSGTSPAFSPNGQTLAVVNQDGTVTLWDIADPARPRQAGQAPRTAGILAESVAFTPQGTLATASLDGTIQLWDLNPGYAVRQICSTTTLTPRQWRQYLPQLPYQPPCPQ